MNVSPSRSARPSVKFVLLVGVMAALPAVTTDMYLPSLPEVATDLDTTPVLVQGTITGVLIGGAIGQLLAGPITDRFGRRAPVMVGVAIHVLASILCMLTPGILPLLALRVIQGVGNAAAMTTAMAVIRDRYTGAAASAILSRLMLVVGVAPMLAPTLGSFVAGVAGWRAVFAVLALMGVGLLVLVWRFLPDTLPVHLRRTDGVRGALGGYRALLRDRYFMALTILPGLALGALMSYVAGSPFVLRGGYGLTETEFALLFAINGAGLVLGAQVNAALVRRVAPLRILRVALPLALLMGVVLLVVSVRETGGLLGLMIPLWFLLTINSVVPPNASALALSRHGERAGSAAAVIGAAQAGIAGVVSPLVGALGEDAVAMSTVILGVVLAAFLVLALATPAYRRGRFDLDHLSIDGHGPHDDGRDAVVARSADGARGTDDTDAAEDARRAVVVRSADDGQDLGDELGNGAETACRGGEQRRRRVRRLAVREARGGRASLSGASTVAAERPDVPIA